MQSMALAPNPNQQGAMDQAFIHIYLGELVSLKSGLTTISQFNFIENIFL